MTSKKKPAKKPTLFIEVQESLVGEWYFTLCRVKDKKMVMMSGPQKSPAACYKKIKALQRKKNLDPTLFVVTVTEYKMAAEMRHDTVQS